MSGLDNTVGLRYVKAIDVVFIGVTTVVACCQNRHHPLVPQGNLTIRCIREQKDEPPALLRMLIVAGLFRLEITQ